MQELLAPHETSFADLPYLFQRNLALSLGFEALGDLQPLHLSMFEPHGDQLAWPHGRREQMLQLFLGGTGSGVGFHHHGAAMNAILFGRKQWWLLPPYGHVIMDPELRPGAEGSTALGELPIAPLRVQEAGEVMCMPANGCAVGSLAPDRSGNRARLADGRADPPGTRKPDATEGASSGVARCCSGFQILPWAAAAGLGAGDEIGAGWAIDW